LSIVDQQKIRRSRTGLTAHDPALAQPGYTLFTPMYGDGTVYLIDMAGEVAHSWHLPYRPGLYGHLLPNGHLFYGGKVMQDLDRFEAWPRFKAGAALAVRRAENVFASEPAMSGAVHTPRLNQRAFHEQRAMCSADRGMRNGELRRQR